jgi:hypothetical protein
MPLWGLVTLAAMLGIAELLHHFRPSWVPGCGFYQLTGWPCPFCGGTRSLVALAQGNWADAFRLSPLAMAMASLTIVLVPVILAGKWPKRMTRPAFVAVVLAIVANWAYLITSKALGHWP